jgi:hypothetical protein
VTEAVVTAIAIVVHVVKSARVQRINTRWATSFIQFHLIRDDEITIHPCGS